MLKRVRISNYKSLGWVEVDLDPVTVLIGRSGTGKSNFLEALRFLRDYLIHRDESALSNYGGWDRVLSATAERPLLLSFSLWFSAPGVAGDYDYHLSFHQNSNQEQPKFREEKLGLDGRVLFHQERGKWQHQPEILNPPQPGPLMLGALTGIREVTIALLVLTNGLGCYSFPDRVLLAESAYKPDEIGLTQRGENYLQVFSAITTDLQNWHYHKEIVAALQSLNPSIKGVDLQLPHRGKIVVTHAVGKLPLVLDLNQESEGLRRFLAHLIALYQTPAKQTLIFEEPEKGIHPGALATLADQFKACPDSGRGQVILTSHSPDLLDHFAPEQIRVVKMEEYVTKIGPLAPEQVEALREQLLRPGELLTVDPARLAAVGAEQG